MSATYYPTADRATYYDAGGRIRASDARSAKVRPGYATQPYQNLRTVFEEYRYDALGRRVAVRARKYCAAGEGALCAISTMRRTVWDGGRELHEITMPGADGTASSTLENDTLPVTTIFARNSGPAFDPSTLFGRELYVYGATPGGPEAVIRSDYTVSLTCYDGLQNPYDCVHTFKPRTVLLGWNTSGGFVGSIIAETGVSYYGEPGQPGYGDVLMRAPGSIADMAYPGTNGAPPPTFGTLVTDRRDEAGTLFRMNRSYDPLTGRFTQEDPIGFGGGLNLYSYAGGDPINFSDPWGLLPTVIIIGFPGGWVPIPWPLPPLTGGTSGGCGPAGAMKDCSAGTGGYGSGGGGGGGSTIGGPSAAACYAAAGRAVAAVVGDLTFLLGVGAAFKAGFAAAGAAEARSGPGFLNS